VERFADWVKHLIFFHGIRHPRELNQDDILRFLAHLRDSQRLPLASLHEAHDALRFLYREVLRFSPADCPVPQALPPASSTVGPPQRPRLFDQMRDVLRGAGRRLPAAQPALTVAAAMNPAVARWRGFGRSCRPVRDSSDSLPGMTGGGDKINAPRSRGRHSGESRTARPETWRVGEVEVEGQRQAGL
jgi:hypothetical protein